MNTKNNADVSQSALY